MRTTSTPIGLRFMTSSSNAVASIRSAPVRPVVYGKWMGWVRVAVVRVRSTDTAETGVLGSRVRHVLRPPLPVPDFRSVERYILSADDWR